MVSVEELAALIDLALRGPHTAAEELFVKGCAEKVNAAIAAQKQAADKPDDAPGT